MNPLRSTVKSEGGALITGAAGAAEAMIASARARPWGLAVAALADGEIEFALDSGDEELTEDSYFQIGSITKTMTGLLLADASLRGETALTATVGSILGADADITLLDLATHRSGLPHWPPNLAFEEDDPFAGYTEADLLDAVRLVQKPTPGTFGYSNMGFMLLGLLLSRITGITYADLLKQQIFEPLGMTAALGGVSDAGSAIPGYRGGSRTPWWSDRFGAGGVASSIRGLATYCASHLSPPSSMINAVELAVAEHAKGPPPMGLGWFRELDAQFREGGTGGFRSYICIHRPTVTGVVLLANGFDATHLRNVGARVLTELVNTRL